MGRVWLRYATGDGVPRRSLGVAAVVGTILNAINQGDALVGGEPLAYTKVILTYVVPYLVATYGAVTVRLAADRRSAAGPAGS
jgi:hypothetical protein